MAWIHTIEPDEASGPLASLYTAIQGARGGVASVHKAQSLHPRALRAHLDIYRAIVLSRSALGRIARERIAVCVSAANQCPYCVAHHAAALRHLGDDPSVIDTLSAGAIPDDLPPPDRALLRWVQTITVAPADCAERDLDALRAHGLTDAELLDASLTASYFAFVNRLALSLGTAIEPDYEDTCHDGEIA